MDPALDELWVTIQHLEKRPKPRLERGEPVRDGGPAEAAQFIRQSLADLMLMAQRHRLDMLAYLLDMAQLEASEIVRLKGRSD